jgi:hypothetical protein
MATEEKLFINLTRHPISVFTGGRVIRIERSGLIARAVIETTIERIGEVPVATDTVLAIEGLPEPKEGVIYIVSQRVVEAARDRDDLVCPDTSPSSAVRDEESHLIGVAQLRRRRRIYGE